MELEVVRKPLRVPLNLLIEALYRNAVVFSQSPIDDNMNPANLQNRKGWDH